MSPDGPIGGLPLPEVHRYRLLAVWTLWVWGVIRQAISANGHSGYDLPFNPLRLLLVYRGPRLHDLHHARVEGNYGLMYILDRAFCSETGVKEERRVPRLQKYFGNRFSWTGWHRSSARTRRTSRRVR